MPLSRKAIADGFRLLGLSDEAERKRLARLSEDLSSRKPPPDDNVTASHTSAVPEPETDAQLEPGTE